MTWGPKTQTGPELETIRDADENVSYPIRKVEQEARLIQVPALSADTIIFTLLSYGCVSVATTFT